MSYKRWRLLMAFGIAFSLAILYNFDPASTTGIYPPSLVRKFTGFYCPGCGATRAMHQFLHGNWQTALSLNLLMVAFLIYIIYWSIALPVRIYLKIDLPTIILKTNAIKAIALIVILFGILRNIPIFPFSWLAPG